jgi:hypothetical protein
VAGGRKEPEMVDWEALRKEIDEEHGELDECGCGDCRKIVDEAIQGNWHCEVCGYDGEPVTMECACYDFHCNPTARGAGCFHGGLTCPLCDDGDRIDVVARALMRAVRRAPSRPRVDVDQLVLRMTMLVRGRLLQTPDPRDIRALLDIMGEVIRGTIHACANPLPIPQWLKDMRIDSAQPWVANARDEKDGPPYEVWHSGGCGGRIGSFDDLKDAQLVEHMTAFLVRAYPPEPKTPDTPKTQQELRLGELLLRAAERINAVACIMAVVDGPPPTKTELNLGYQEAIAVADELLREGASLNPDVGKKTTWG